MPTKFVTRSAEKAGVSIETAEHRWHEAKKAVKKGKRRGSWYWGKVVQTFKRMMGLSEGITFGEFLLLEMEEMAFSHWPEVIRLYGPYIAVRDQHYDHYIKYEVEELMGDRINVQLAASVIRGHNDAYEGGASYTLGKDGHFTQGLGIKVPADEAYDVAEFKKWAIEAMQTGAKKLGLTESDQGQYKNDTSERSMIHKIVDLLCQDGQMKGGQSEANLEKAYDFLESDWGGKLWDKHYELFVSMHPSFEGPMNRVQYGTFKREAVAWYKKWKNGARFVGEPIEKMHEAASYVRK